MADRMQSTASRHIQRNLLQTAACSGNFHQRLESLNHIRRRHADLFDRNHCRAGNRTV